MNFIKTIIGIVLLAVGVGMITGGVWVSYEIFTGKRAVPEFFSMPEALKDIAESQYQANQAQEGSEENAQQAIKQAISEQINSILPADFLPKMFNLTVWSIFVFILIYGGNKIAILGIKLMNAPKEQKDNSS